MAKNHKNKRYKRVYLGYFKIHGISNKQKFLRKIICHTSRKGDREFSFFALAVEQREEKNYSGPRFGAAVVSRFFFFHVALNGISKSRDRS